MSKSNSVSAQTQKVLPVEALILECKKDRYRLSYSALRWAKEIKQKESLPESISALVPRALREILTGKVTYKEIEKLPYLAKLVSTPAAPPPVPTIILNESLKEKDEEPSKKK